MNHKLKQIKNLHRWRSNRNDSTFAILENNGDLVLCPALSTTQKNKHKIQINNFPNALKTGMHAVDFSILTPEQPKQIRSVNHTSVR